MQMLLSVGAGFAKFIFCKNSTKVIELRPKPPE